MIQFYTLYQEIDEDGSYERDPRAGISQFLIIEAHNAKQAYDIAGRIGIRDFGRWNKIEYIHGDQVPSIHGTPIAEVEFQPDEIAHEELDRGLAYIHYLDGRVQAVMPQIRLVTEPARPARDHQLRQGRDYGGWRERVECEECEAEFTVPRGTDIDKLAISGCRGAGQGHPDGCECPVCDPL